MATEQRHFSQNVWPTQKGVVSFSQNISAMKRSSNEVAGASDSEISNPKPTKQTKTLQPYAFAMDPCRRDLTAQTLTLSTHMAFVASSLSWICQGIANLEVIPVQHHQESREEKISRDMAHTLLRYLAKSTIIT